MKNAKKWIPALVAVVVLQIMASQAQVTTGIPPYQSFGGGPEVINLGNLNLHYSIPVFSRAGRSLSFNYALAYDSSIWTPTGGAWVPNSNWGLHRDTAALVGYVAYKFSETNCRSGDGLSVRDQWHYTSYVDAAGTAHPFRIDLIDDGCTGASTLSGTAVVSDGSGITITADVTPSATVTLASGQKITPQLLASGTLSGTGNQTDSNGNQITSSTVSGTITFTDTLGTTALTISGTAPSPVSYKYTAPSGVLAAVIVSYKSYTVQTAFGCTSVPTEYGPLAVSLVDKITLPDGSYYQFGFETTPGDAHSPHYVTGRVISVRLRTGGTISYTYTGGDTNKGIMCGDGSTAGFNRTTPDTPTGQFWSYTRAGTSPAYTTTITSPPDPVTTVANVTSIQFQGNYETQRDVYQGAATGTPLETTYTCYNGNGVTSPSTCPTLTLASPFSRIANFRSLNGGSLAETDTAYDGYGNVVARDAYDFGVSTPATKTAIMYGGTYDSSTDTCAVLTNNIVDRACKVTTTDDSGNLQAKTTYGYDEAASLQNSGITTNHVSVTGSRGNRTSAKTYVTSTATLIRNFKNYDTGLIYQSQDVNAQWTTYTYGACAGAFLTQVSLPLSLSKSATWDCRGGVMTTSTDENSKVSYMNYTTDAYFWRPENSKDALGNITSLTYIGATQLEAVLPVVSGQSSVDVLNSVDSLGRPYITQVRQAPASSNFDTSNQVYDSFGRPNKVPMPCVKTSGIPCPTVPSTTTNFDGAGRPVQVTDGGGGTLSVTYSENDVLSTLGPALNGEHVKSRQSQYDGLGRLSSVCEILASGGTSCGQNSPASGYLTSYAYTVLASGGTKLVVTKGAQSRTFIYDALGRLGSESNPENGSTTYVYDSDSACTFSGLSATSKGDLVSKTDANGNKTCYSYDAVHRLTDVGVLKNGACYPPVKRFRYDATSNRVLPIPTGYSANNARARMVEAWTGDCVWPTPQTGLDSATDEWFSYSARGEMTDLWESTSHIAGYYHGTASYAANGALSSIGGVPGYTTITYGLDGEGRLKTAIQGATNLVTGVSYTAASQPGTVSLGAGDSDTYGYDANTGRLLSYTFSVNGVTDSGALTWNANGSLGKLVVTDHINSGGSQTCKYGDPTASVAGYDDLGRLLKADCSPVWSQTFSYDQYGNITKSGNSLWNPGYDPLTNRASAPIAYDSNGNLISDSLHTYGWYVDNKLGSTDSTTCTIFSSSNGTCILYDAFGREVERGFNGAYTEVMYTPVGKTAIMNGQTATLNAYFPLPGGGTYDQTGSANGNGYFWHKDWLGSVRLSSSVLSRTSYYDRAFAPNGEMYDNLGNTTGLSFTGDTQDSFVGLLFDTPNRELSPAQGRWMSPDPAGLGVVNPTNPQTWNRYAYVGNDPLNTIDPLGLLGPGGDARGSVDDMSCVETYSCNTYSMNGMEVNARVAQQWLHMGSAVRCPQCGNNFTGNTGGDFSLLAAANGLVWINNHNGQEINDAAAAEAGLDDPVSLQSLPDNPNDLRLTTKSDNCVSGDRTILYWLVKSSGGSLATGSWTVTEQIESNERTNSGGSGDSPNKYTDLLTQALTPNPYTAIQSFKISVGGRSFPVFVNIGGKDFGKLGLWISGNPLRNGQPSPHIRNCPPR